MKPQRKIHKRFAGRPVGIDHWNVFKAACKDRALFRSVYDATGRRHIAWNEEMAKDPMRFGFFERPAGECYAINHTFKYDPEKENVCSTVSMFIPSVNSYALQDVDRAMQRKRAAEKRVAEGREARPRRVKEFATLELLASLATRKLAKYAKKIQEGPSPTTSDMEEQEEEEEEEEEEEKKKVEEKEYPDQHIVPDFDPLLEELDTDEVLARGSFLTQLYGPLDNPLMPLNHALLPIPQTLAPIMPPPPPKPQVLATKLDSRLISTNIPVPRLQVSLSPPRRRYQSTRTLLSNSQILGRSQA
jgi:hypothetical protein